MTYESRKPFFPPAATTREFAHLLAATTLALYDACLVGSPPPNVLRIYSKMTDPRPGDLVLEVRCVDREDWPAQALGRLIFVCDTKPETGAEWAVAVSTGYFKMEPGHGPGRYWMVDPIDGTQRTCWEGARFIRVLDPDDRVIRPFPEADLAEAGLAVD